MSAQMKASVLLTLKDELTSKAKAAVKGLQELGGAASKVKGTNALGKMAGEATALAGAADKAAAGLARIGSSGAGAGAAGAGLAAAARQADALAASANRAAVATQKAASAGAAAQKAAGATIIPGRSGPVPVKGAEHERATAIATNLDRANPGRYRGVKGGELLEKDVAEAMKAEAKGGTNVLGGGKDGAVNKALGAYLGYQIGKGIVHGADHTLQRVGDVEAMREKLKWSMGGDKAGADAAYAKAMELSGKYKNTSVIENLHIIDDLRANLPESMDKILGDIADPFVRMHGFFKAWEGGKHAGKAEGALKEVGAAIRAGELTGAMTGDLLAQHTQALANAKVLFGEKFKVQEYFQATQKAATMLSAADATFKYVDFPVLVQRLSQGGGVAARGMFQKLVAGSTVSQSTAEAWRKLGLVDESQVELDKNGRIKASQLPGKAWLKGGDEYGVNMTDAIMTKLVPALSEKGGIAALQGQKLAMAWKAGDVESVVHILEAFRHDQKNLVELSRAVTALGKDPKATQGIEELILGAASILRDRQRGLAIQKNLEDFESYDKAKQSVSAQADRLWQSVMGTGTVQRALNKLAGWLGSAADAVTKADNWMRGRGYQFANDADARAGGWAWLARLNRDNFKADGGFGKEVWDWGKLPEAGAMGAAGRAGAVGFEGGEAAGRARAANAGGRYQLGGSEAREAEAQAIASGDGPATAAAGAEPVYSGTATAPITIQAVGPQVSFNQAPPNISINVTVNATTNASAGEIGAAAAGQVRSALGGALHDGGQ